MRLSYLSATLSLVLVSTFVAACSTGRGPKTSRDNFNETLSGDQSSSSSGEVTPMSDQHPPDMDFLKEMARRSVKQAQKCDMPDNKGPRDVANVDVTFEPSGMSGDVVVHPPHEGTQIGDCVRQAFKRVFAARFDGNPVVIKVEVDFSKKAEPDKKTDESKDKKPEESKDKKKP